MLHFHFRCEFTFRFCGGPDSSCRELWSTDRSAGPLWSRCPPSSPSLSYVTFHIRPRPAGRLPAKIDGSLDVIYGDTDSVMISTGLTGPDVAPALRMAALVKKVQPPPPLGPRGRSINEQATIWTTPS